MIGPGKYDVLATIARETAMAQAVVLIVLGGKHGNGFSVQSTGEPLWALPDLLEHTATRDPRGSRIERQHVTAQETLLVLAREVVAYDEAIQACANDPERMSSFCTAEGEDLDTLFLRAVTLARFVVLGGDPWKWLLPPPP